jgi:rhodanese-related sulfurtransferase
LVTVLDVRSENEFRLGHLPSALNIPFAELEHRLAEIPRHGAPPFRDGSLSLALH